MKSAETLLQRRAGASLCGLLWIGLLACGASAPSLGAPPTAPTTNDASFSVQWLRNWYVIENAVSAGHPTLKVRVTAPAGTQSVEAWINGVGTQLWLQDNAFVAEISLDAVPAGQHELLLRADGDAEAFWKHSFARSHPLYVLMTTDWDFAEPSQAALTAQDRFHEAHPELRLTHFVGPYTFTDPALDASRKQAIANWVIAQRETYGDEIGLHIHPYCHFVEAADLPCNTTDSVVYASDPSGYTINLSSYGDAPMRTLLTKADELFVQNGLGKPTTFRAGAWTASIETLRALAATDYVADTSACNWARLEEWQDQGNGELYRWNMANWGPIGDTNQPYYPNQDNALVATAPQLPILEVPDNGIMMDYISIAELTDILNANWDGTPLLAPRTLMLGYHPSPQFAVTLAAHVDAALTLLDGYLAARDAGPLEYAVLRDMPKVFLP